MIYASRLRFYEPFFSNVIFCVCSLFFSLNPMSILQSTHQIFSITPLFNLLALRSKLNQKSVLMECMFFLLNFLYNIYLFTFVFKAPLVYAFMNLFFQCDFLCLFFVFSLNPMSILHELLNTFTVQLLTKKNNKNIGGRKIYEYRKSKALTKFVFNYTSL
jgi:hypothetical protein